jgi:hypothetical protein
MKLGRRGVDFTPTLPYGGAPGQGRKLLKQAASGLAICSAVAGMLIAANAATKSGPSNGNKTFAIA